MDEYNRRKSKVSKRLLIMRHICTSVMQEIQMQHIQNQAFFHFKFISLLFPISNGLLYTYTPSETSDYYWMFPFPLHSP